MAARRAVQNANPFSKGDKFWQGLDLHFLHHPMAVGLDRARRGSEFIRDLLVDPASHHQIEYLPLARRQSRDMSASHLKLELPATRHFMTRDSPFDCVKKVVRRYGLGQKILGTRPDSLHRGWNIRMTSEKNDGQSRAELAQATLELRSTQFRYPYVEEDAAEFNFARQTIQQLLGRRAESSSPVGSRYLGRASNL